MKISNFNVSNITEPKEFQRMASILLGNMISVLNGGIVFADNFNSNVQSVTFDSANTEVRIEHNLGRVPTGYLPLNLSAASSIYNGASANTTQFVFLRASAPVTTTIMLF